jgi:hypothetical protein
MAIIALVAVSPALVPIWVSAIITPVTIAFVFVVVPTVMSVVAIAVSVAVMVRGADVKSKGEMSRPHRLHEGG